MDESRWARLATDLRAVWAAITDLTRRVEHLEHDNPEEPQ